MRINFISSKGLIKTCMTKIDSVKIMMGGETNDIIEKQMTLFNKKKQIYF